MILLIAAAYYFLADSLYDEETSVFGLGFAASIAYNLFKVRQRSEESNSESAPGEDHDSE